MNIPRNKLQDIEDELAELMHSCLLSEKKFEKELSEVHPNHSSNAKNFVHYLAFRNVDLRTLQHKLSALGLSSLGRAESHVLYNILSVRNILRSILQQSALSTPYIQDIDSATKLLAKNTETLFHKSGKSRRVQIMVTLPTRAAEDSTYVEQLMQAGMNVARINCAHDTPAAWQCMMENIKKSRKKLKVTCPVFMDLAGPKLRTEVLHTDKYPKKYVVKKNDIIQLVGKNHIDKVRCNVVFGCTLEPLFTRIFEGHRVLLDDGKIEAVVTESSATHIVIKVTHTGPDGAKLKKDKSINLPDSELGLYGLTEKDKKDLEFVIEHADGVNVSFVNRPEDVKEILDTLQMLQKPDFPFTLKIETQEGFKKLPQILLEAMKGKTFGIFIARGDLAVECGWERMAEIQEEILWMCEAACIPIIWGTQVLENMVKTGIPSRAEITDAAMSQRAECVMLNKGPYVIEAIKMLDKILLAMQDHQRKKVSSLRKLNVADI